jgi:hypothetical protein
LEQGLHLSHRQSLHKPCLNFIAPLRLVIQAQFLKRTQRLLFDLGKGAANLMVRQERPLLAILHHVR